jgi:hypothetical protein
MRRGPEFDALVRLLPPHGLPLTPHAGREATNWLFPEEAEWLRRRPHPRFGPRDVVYRFNREGYRCDEINYLEKGGLLSIGCSWTFGTGYPSSTRFQL